VEESSGQMGYFSLAVIFSSLKKVQRLLAFSGYCKKCDMECCTESSVKETIFIIINDFSYGGSRRIPLPSLKNSGV
jgi:hypothetical protein